MQIYTSVPDQAMIKGVPHRSIIYHYLRAVPDKFVTAFKIAVDCGYPTKGSQVEVRKAITELIEMDKRPIISTGKGFAYTKNQLRLKHYQTSLINRMVGLDRRILAIGRIIDGEIQAEL